MRFKFALHAAARKLRAGVIAIGCAFAIALYFTAHLRGEEDKPAATDDAATPSHLPTNPLRRASDPSTTGDPVPPSGPALQAPTYQARPAQSPFDSGAQSSYSPGIFDQLPSRRPIRPAANEVIRGMPSPSDSYPSSMPPQQSAAGDDDQNCGPNFNGPHENQHQLQALPGSGTPTMFQPEHYPRYMGFGEPLVGTSWQNRPFHVDFFAGDMIGDDAIDGVIGQEAGFFTGGRIGWDYDYYWGLETRLGISWMSLFDRQNPLNNIGTGNIIVWDMSLLYYPWGDSRWRPFILLGTGIEQFDSYGSSPAVYSGTLFELPFGGGLKYRFNEWLIFRVDVIDNLAFGTGSLDTMHNVSFSGGVEYHFGGHRRTYWPWNPNPKH